MRFDDSNDLIRQVGDSKNLAVDALRQRNDVIIPRASDDSAMGGNRSRESLEVPSIESDDGTAEWFANSS